MVVSLFHIHSVTHGIWPWCSLLADTSMMSTTWTTRYTRVLAAAMKRINLCRLELRFRNCFSHFWPLFLPHHFDSDEMIEITILASVAAVLLMGRSSLVSSINSAATAGGPSLPKHDARRDKSTCLPQAGACLESGGTYLPWPIAPVITPPFDSTFSGGHELCM